MMSTLTMIIISRLGVFYETFRPSRFLSLCHINETFEMCVFVFASSTALFFSYVCVCVSAYAIIDLRNSPVSLFINKRPLESQYFIRNVMLALNDFFHWCWCSTQLRNNNKVPHEPNKNDIANSSNGLNFVVLMKRIYAWLKTIFLGINRGLEGKRKMEKKRRKKKMETRSACSNNNAQITDKKKYHQRTYASYPKKRWFFSMVEQKKWETSVSLFV